MYVLNCCKIKLTWEDYIMKKFLALSLAVIMSVTFLGGCGSASKQTPETSGTEVSTQAGESSTASVVDKYKETKELEFMAWWPVTPSDDDEVIKAVEKKFNVELKLTLADWEPNINNIATRVASGNYPDYMLMPYYWVNTLGAQYTALIEDGLIVNMSEAVKKNNLVNLQSELDKAAQSNSKMKSIYGDKNGDFYSLPRNDGYPNPGIFIRKDWLDKLGLQAPKTTDELYNVLKTFVEKQPDGKKTYGLTCEIGSLEQIVTTFTGVNTSGWTKQDGAWTNKIMMPEFKEALKYLNKMYNEGILDKEFAIAKINDSREKFLTGSSGAVIQNANRIDFIDLLQTPLQKYNSAAVVSCLSEFPKGPSGKRNSGNTYGSCGVLFKNSDEEKNTRVLDILDWFLTPEGTDLMLNGVEGVHYNKQGDKVEYTDKWQVDFHGIEHHLMRHFIFPGVVKEASPLFLSIPDLAANYQDIIKNGATEEVLGLNTELTAEKYPKMNDVYTKWFIHFVTGKANIDTDYQKFVDEYNKAGYGDILKEVENYMAK